MAIADSNNTFINSMITWGTLPEVNIDGRFSWTGTTNQSATIKYSFNPTKFFNNNNPLINNSPALELTGSDKALMAKAFSTWSNVAKVTFTLNDSSPNLFIGDVNFQTFNDPIDGEGMIAPFSRSGSDLNSCDILFNINVNGGTTFSTMVHEIGHSLGVSHPGGGNGSNSAFDNSKSIMSINKYGGLFASSPMLYDIAAAQYLYGANMTYRNTGTKYSADADSATNVRITGEAKLWTVWDAGGTDTFDFSKVAAASAGCTIDLRGGVDASGKVNFTKVGQEYIAIASDPATKWTSSIIIENAVGGSGKDIIYGNMGNNSLKGGLGNDLIVAGKGQDSVYGQDGNDTLSDSWWTGLDYTGLSNSKDTLSGGNGNDQLTSYDGADLLKGENGNDKIWFMQSANGGQTVTGIKNPAGAKYLEHDDVFSFGANTKVESNSMLDRIIVLDKNTSVNLLGDSNYHTPSFQSTKGLSDWSYKGVVMVNPTAFVDITGGDHESRLVIGDQLLEGSGVNEHIIDAFFITDGGSSDAGLLIISTNEFVHKFSESTLSASQAPDNNLGGGFHVVAQEGTATWKILEDGGSITLDILNGTRKVATIHDWHNGDFGLIMDNGVRVEDNQLHPVIFDAAPTAFTAATYLQSLSHAVEYAL